MRMLFWTYVAVCSMMAPVVLIEERCGVQPHPAFHGANLDRAWRC